MTNTFDSMVKSGGTQLAGLFYIAGMPWAVTTTPALINNITAAYRKKLFGNATVDGGSTYPSDYVTVLPGLDPDFGTQVIRYSEDGGIQQDSWSVTFDRQGDSVDFTKYFADAREGILGLDIMPDVDHAGVYKATLTSAWKSTSASSTFTASFDDDFETWFDAKITATDWPILWVENQALLCSGRSGSTISAKNCLYTKYSYIPRGDAVNERIRATSVPINGLVGFNAYLYLIEVNENGTIVNPDAMPIIYRSGRVQQNSLSSHGFWTISCDSWVSILDQTLPISTFSAKLSGYMLTRPNTGTLVTIASAFGSIKGVVQPHLVLWEDPHVWVPTDIGPPVVDGHWQEPVKSSIWLCAPGDYVYFNTIDDLNQAVATELYKIQAGTSTYNTDVTLTFAYEIVDSEPVWRNPVTWNTGWVYAGGLLPLICGWGWTSQLCIDTLRGDVIGTSSDQYVALRNGKSLDGLPYLEVDQVSDWMGYFYQYQPHYFKGSNDQFPNMLIRFSGPCEYFYDWALDTDDIANAVSQSAGAIPIAQNRVYITTEDVSEIQEDIILSLGRANDFGNGRLPNIVYSKALSATWDNTTNHYYITLKPDSTYTDVASTTVAKWRSGGIRDGIQWPASVGKRLYYSTDIHDVDPWPMHFYSESRSDKLSDILKSVLGETVSGITLIQRQYTLLNIPDVTGYTSTTYGDNMGRTLIDWNSLDRLTAWTIPGAEYRYTIGTESGDIEDSDGGEKTFLKQLNAALITHRVQPAWEYCEAQRAWWITFTELGVDNVTDAALSGRTYTAEDFEEGQNMPVTIGDQWVISEIIYRSEIRKNIIFSDNGFTIGFDKGELKIRKKSPYKIQSKGTKVLEVEDRIISPSRDSIFYLDRNIGQILGRLSLLCDVQRVTCVPSTITKIAVGKEMLLSGTQIRDHNTGEYGASDIVAKIMSCDMALVHPRITIRVNNRPMRAISPSLYISYNNMSRVDEVITVTGLSTDPTENKFEPVTSGLTDLERFDCLHFNPSTNAVESVNCTCGDYRVILLKRDQTDMAYESEYWLGTISNINGSAGSCTITLDSDTGFSIGGQFVLFFAPYSDASIQPHQKIWAWWGNASGRVTDASGVSRLGAVIA